MNDKTIARICLAITLISLISLVLTYKPDFEETTLTKIIQEPQAKGKIFGRIDYVIKNYPITQFILNDGNTAVIYYPKATTLVKNDFVTAYVENQGQKTLFAQKVVKE